MMEERHYAFFQNRDCEYFPCHATKHPEDFNCLFCYCPLYALGRGCGGNFRYTENGIKDCSGCLFPHRRENYDRVIARFMEIVKKNAGRRVKCCRVRILLLLAMHRELFSQKTGTLLPVECRTSFCRLLGTNPESVLGQESGDFFPPCGYTGDTNRQEGSP